MESLRIRIETAPASEDEGYVGRVLFGRREVYRTIDVHPTATEAFDSAFDLVGAAFGTLLAEEEQRIRGARPELHPATTSPA